MASPGNPDRFTIFSQNGICGKVWAAHIVGQWQPRGEMRVNLFCLFGKTVAGLALLTAFETC